MKNNITDAVVGIFLIIGFIALGWLALQLGEVPWLTGGRMYVLEAEFGNISGLKEGADVQIAGVKVGTVKQLTLNEDAYAMVTMQIDRGVQVPLDSIASVKSQGIIGDKYIQITLGGDEQFFAAGETMTETESAVDLESLISKFAFGQVD
ncbi:MAG: outer membrane lipid asymmetry maintenance protein MlaD [Desulfobulbaceae bacterium]|jgi:phospholipid/cholesterol/gamma-HCH transport system substrate-binding protein|nr:outer membrane lipid asymmetry maintenance protein MlaD [Desulfobulbaceae bacterium]MDY0350563.1 outer membrane lipid asymmetry maintenance protein MlaD [Desulfobulbaceae bacterium]